MAPISRDDLEAAHRGMVTALENVLFDLGEVGRTKVRELTDAHWEIVTELKDKLEESESTEADPARDLAEMKAVVETIDSLRKRLEES